MKYDNYDNYENTIYEYSFIYIKLHIKNYLNSFKYFLKLKKLHNFIKGLYYPAKLMKLKKYYRRQYKGLSFWSFTIFNNYFFRLKYFYFYFFLKTQNLFNYIRLNFIRWLSIWKQKNLTYHVKASNFIFFSFFCKFKSIFNSLWNDNFILIKKKHILLYYNFFLKKKLYRKTWILLKHDIETVYKYFLGHDKKKIFKTIDDVKIPTTGDRQADIRLRKNFLKSKLFQDLIYKRNLIRDINYELSWVKVWVSFCKTPVLAYFPRYLLIIELIEIFESFFSYKVKITFAWLNYAKLLKKAIKIYGKDFNSYYYCFFIVNVISSKLTSSTFINQWKKKSTMLLLIRDNLINFIDNYFLHRFRLYLQSKVPKVFRKIVNYIYEIRRLYLKEGTYKYISYDKPYGWIYFFFLNLKKKLRNYLKGIKKWMFIEMRKLFNFIYYKSFNLILVNQKFYNIKKIINFITNIFNYFIKKGFFFNKYEYIPDYIYIKNTIFYQSYRNYYFFVNFYYFKFKILLQNWLKKTLFFNQFKFIYEKFFILQKINNINYTPNLKIDILLNYKKLDWNLLKIVDRGDFFKKDYLSKYSAFIKKKTYIDYFYYNRFLIGYKIRFAGRFKRRRKRSIMWLKKGLTPITGHDKWIDYGAHEIANQFSQYSVRIWLNKNTNVKYKHYLKF